jgi:hypothetical protein
MIGRMLAVCGVLATGPALANDSIAELGTGGLILSRTDAISMEKENLFISMDKVQVDYVFRNTTEKDVEALVAFPMPTVDANPYTMPMLPDATSDNFLDFDVSFDGKAIKPELEQKAFAVDIDVSEELKAHGVPVNPFIEGAYDALAKLSDDVAKDWIDRGMIFVDSYDDGSGWKDVRSPLWSLKSTYFWKTTFPASKQVKVRHNYKPSVGGTAGLSFYWDGKFQDGYKEYQKKYCIDQAFEKAIRKAAAEAPDGYPLLQEMRLEYVLTSGGNWALGMIGDYTLTVDKGDPKALISLCANNLKKTGPTTFTSNEKEFYPQQDISILILKPYELSSDDEPAASRSVGGEKKTRDASQAFSERARHVVPQVPAK